MAIIKGVSIPDDKAAPILNFFAKYPDIGFSKLMVRLLLEHIQKADPKLLEVDAVKTIDKPVYDDYLELLKTAVEAAVPQRITRAQVHHVLNRKFGTDEKKAEKILASLDPLLRKHGLEWERGCLVPFKPYFSERKKAARAKGV